MRREPSAEITFVHMSLSGTATGKKKNLQKIVYTTNHEVRSEYKGRTGNYSLVSCSQTTMSSERDPLLATSSQNRGNVRNEEAREEKRLGPLEISRSNQWAILAGIWTASFLGVRRTTSFNSRC